MSTKRIVIVGDDFTPADLFRQAISGLPDTLLSRLELVTRDITDAAYHAGPVDGVREFLGSPDMYLDLVPGANVLVTTFAPVTALVLDHAPSLQLIVSGRGGPINIDTAAATARGIPVAFSLGRNSEAVSELVLGLMLALTRQILPADRYTRSGEWTSGREDTFAKPTGPEMEGRTLGIIGFGAIGARVGELVKPLRMRVIAHDPFLPPDRIAAAGAEPADVDTLLQQADVVTVHARPGAGKGPLIGARELRLMRRGSYLINTSRGVNISEPDLVEALNSGHLAGAALDVYGTEPLPADHPLLRAPNTILTPHTCGVSLDVPAHTARVVAGTLAQWLSTGQLPHVINPEVLKR